MDHGYRSGRDCAFWALVGVVLVWHAIKRLRQGLRREALWSGCEQENMMSTKTARVQAIAASAGAAIEPVL